MHTQIHTTMSYRTGVVVHMAAQGDKLWFFVPNCYLHSIDEKRAESIRYVMKQLGAGYRTFFTSTEWFGLGFSVLKTDEARKSALDSLDKFGIMDDMVHKRVREMRDTPLEKVESCYFLRG